MTLYDAVCTVLMAQVHIGTMWNHEVIKWRFVVHGGIDGFSPCNFLSEMCG